MGFHFARIFQLEECFVKIQGNQLSECHKLAMEFQISILNSCGNVIQMSNDAAKKKKKLWKLTGYVCSKL